jgi:hypothetical protein
MHALTYTPNASCEGLIRKNVCQYRGERTLSDIHVAEEMQDWAYLFAACSTTSTKGKSAGGKERFLSSEMLHHSTS